MTINYSLAAIDDLARMHEYYSDRAGGDVAQRLTRRVKDTLERLISRNPRVGRQRPEHGGDVRSFPVLPYIVFYSSDGGGIHVIRILHGHRDIHPPLVSLLLAV